MYQDEAQRKAVVANYASTEDFVRSLALKIKLHRNPPAHIARMAQLTQKTNQFNLTTARYSEEDIARFVADPRALVLSLDAEDRFGQYGLTGLCIALLNPDRVTAHIDTFLLSCRILGRHIEMAFLDALISESARAGAQRISACYRRTARNHQVEDYYERSGFTLLEEVDGVKRYELLISAHKEAAAGYIGVEYA